VHRRAIEIKGRALRVSDTVSGRGIHRAAGYYHFHPDVRLEQTAPGDWAIHLQNGSTLRILGRDGVDLRQEEGKYALEFGRSVLRPVLVWRIERELPLEVTVEIAEKG